MEYRGLHNTELFQYEGRILVKDDICYMGYTNSFVRFYARGESVRALLISNITEEVNMAGLYIFIDGEKKEVNQVVVDKEESWYELCKLPDDEVHLVTVVKVTEAAMSHVGLVALDVCDGEVINKEFPELPKLKLEFVGDSITCGYGVLGEPMSEYTLREENGLLSYGWIAAEMLHARARFVSASGYGAYIEYTGNLDGNVPKLYPYTNWFVDDSVHYDYREYVPDVVIINLGTNDSGHMHKKEVQDGFVKAYADFVRLIRNTYENTAVLCICGTLCDTMFEWIEKAVAECTAAGMGRIYVRRLPYHDVENDGMASQHPSRVTHRKDGERVAGFIKEILAEM